MRVCMCVLQCVKGIGKGSCGLRLLSFSFLFAEVERHQKWEGAGIAWGGLEGGQSIPIRSVCVERGWKPFYDELLAVGCWLLERKCCYCTKLPRIA